MMYFISESYLVRVASAGHGVVARLLEDAVCSHVRDRRVQSNLGLVEEGSVRRPSGDVQRAEPRGDNTLVVRPRRLIGRIRVSLKCPKSRSKMRVWYLPVVLAIVCETILKNS